MPGRPSNCWISDLRSSPPPTSIIAVRPSQTFNALRPLLCETPLKSLKPSVEETIRVDRGGMVRAVTRARGVS